MNHMDMPVQVPVDDPNADTEWNDILRKHGIIPEKPPSPTPMIEEALAEAQKRAHENRLEDKDLDELAELEDDEDDAFLEQYRAKRLAELSQIQTASLFGQVYHIHKDEYSREVTEASNKAWVLLLLTSSQGLNDESRVLIEAWRQLATKFGDVKFCQMQADMCIENYPNKNTPTVLIYKDTDVKKSIVTLKTMRGVQTSAEDFEALLVAEGAFQASDPRLRVAKPDGEVQSRGKLRGQTRHQSAEDDNEDDEWD